MLLAFFASHCDKLPLFGLESFAVTLQFLRFSSEATGLWSLAESGWFGRVLFPSSVSGGPVRFTRRDALASRGATDPLARREKADLLGGGKAGYPHRSADASVAPALPAVPSLSDGGAQARAVHHLKR